MQREQKKVGYWFIVSLLLGALAMLLLVFSASGCAAPAAAAPLVAIAGTTEVGCHVRNHAFRADVVLTPFAVPVGVPVAPYAGVWYGAQQPAPQAQSATSADTAALFQEFLAWKAARETKALATAEAPPTDVPGLLKTRCAGCHSGADPKGGFRMWGDDGAILKLPRHLILDAVTATDEAHRMPKGKPPLAQAEIDAVRTWAKLPREAVW